VVRRFRFAKASGFTLNVGEFMIVETTATVMLTKKARNEIKLNETRIERYQKDRDICLILLPFIYAVANYFFPVHIPKQFQKYLTDETLGTTIVTGFGLYMFHDEKKRVRKSQNIIDRLKKDKH
jgi:hypothetical protein